MSLFCYGLLRFLCSLGECTRDGNEYFVLMVHRRWGGGNGSSHELRLVFHGR